MKRRQVIEILMMKAQQVLPMLLFILMTSTLYAQQKAPKIVQYDHDVYAEMKTEKDYEFPIKFFLKDGGKMIALEEADFGEGYKYEIDNEKYYAIGTDGRRYLLRFKPQEAVLIEKFEAYVSKCDEIAKDYKQHPEKYEDVTLISNGIHYYIDKSGYEWVYESEGLGIHVLEDEGVFMVFDELKFIRKKEVQIVEEMPEPGYDTQAYLYQNIKYPKDAQSKGEQGKVLLSFVVEKDGSITDVKVIKSVSPSIDKEAVRVVSNMPKWKKPAKQDGKPVRIRFSMPVNFTFQ